MNYNTGVYKHVFNYKDHLDNVRVSYTKDDATGLPVVLEQNHYYPFGLKHTNYNVSILKLRGNTPVAATTSVRKYRHRSYEFQDELGLNWYDFGMRGYMPDIGRWGGVDMLAETSRRFSPYAYCLNNPVYFIDVDGMSATPPDWINWKGENGQQYITYNSAIKTVEQAKAAGYTNVSSVVEQGRAYNASGTIEISLEKKGMYSVNGGSFVKAEDHSFTAPNGTVIDATESGLAQFSGVLQDAGDGLAVGGLGASATGFGAVAGVPLMAVGGTISLAGTIGELVDDAVTGDWSWGKAGTKAALELVPAGTGKAFDALGAPAANTIIEGGAIATDRILNELEQSQVGPYRP